MKSLKIAILERFSKDFKQIQSRFLDLYLSLTCNLLQSFYVNRAIAMSIVFSTGRLLV